MSKKNKNSTGFLTSKNRLSAGFSVPENYFKTVEDNLFAKIYENELPVKTGFTTPENYFNSVGDAVFAKVNFPKKTAKIISFRNKLFTYIPTAAAACVLLFFGLNYFSATNVNVFDSISKTDVENWVDQNYLDLNTVNLPSQFDNIDLTQTNLTDDAATLSDDDIIEYLNTIDNTNLLTNNDI